MRAAFALLGNRQVYNLVRKLAWDIHLKYRTGTRHCRLPPHISLKQPFKIQDLTALEAYMDELAGSIDPFEVLLTEIQVVPTIFGDEEYGILWLDVQETQELRQIHERLNGELSRSFGDTQAAFDGQSYHFHMTVMIGGQPFDVYRQYYSEIPDPKINLRFTVKELAMFVYDEPLGPEGEYLSFKILPVGKLHNPGYKEGKSL